RGGERFQQTARLPARLRFAFRSSFGEPLGEARLVTFPACLLFESFDFCCSRSELLLRLALRLAQERGGSLRRAPHDFSSVEDARGVVRRTPFRIAAGDVSQPRSDGT